MIGQTILNYKIFKSLDEGGMGSVFLAEHILLNHTVVVKVLLRQHASNANVVNRFRQEAQILTHLNHPNIVRLVNFAEDPVYGDVIFMDYVEGQTLRAFQRSFPNHCVPLETMLALFSDLLDGFGYAHDKNIVHRDIKPNNILISSEGKPIILDFGIAKLKDSGLTVLPQLMGTIHYMSPEQISTPLDLDHRSDIYTLGVILYEMLTGKLPYRNTSSAAALMQEIIGSTLLPSLTVTQTPQDAALNGVIARATAPKPTDRYDNCAAFKAELMRVRLLKTQPSYLELYENGERLFRARHFEGAIQAWQQAQNTMDCPPYNDLKRKIKEAEEIIEEEKQKRLEAEKWDREEAEQKRLEAEKRAREEAEQKRLEAEKQAQEIARLDSEKLAQHVAEKKHLKAKTFAEKVGSKIENLVGGDTTLVLWIGTGVGIFVIILYMLVNDACTEKFLPDALIEIQEAKENKQTTLTLSNFHLKHIPETIGDLEQLKSLILEHNKTSDLTVLKKLVQLQSLDLGINKISDLTTLKNLTQLKALDLHDNKISDLDPIKDLTLLQVLQLSDNRIKDISTLKGLNQLTTLSLQQSWINLYCNKISDITTLKDLKQLQKLYLYGNRISDLTALDSLVQLTKLGLGDNKITNIEALKNLTRLEYLNLKENKITDITQLKNLIRLEYLHLKENKITDITQLKNLTKLKALNLDDNKISDITALKDLKDLEILSLRDNKIEYFNLDLNQFPNLYILELEGNPIKNIPKEILSNQNSVKAIRDYQNAAK